MIINRGTSIDEIAKRLVERDNDSGSSSDKKVKSGNHGLVYAVYDGDKYCCDIYLFVDGEKDKLIIQRKGYVHALCEHNEKLYDGGDDVIVDNNTIRETLTEKEVASANKKIILDMCSHQGNLYYLTKKGINNVFTGAKIERSKEGSLSLCSHKGELYEAGTEGIVYRVSTTSEIKGKGSSINALCSHDGKLYCGDADNRVFEIDGGITATVEEAILPLCSHNGRLYAGTYGIIPHTHGKIYEVPSGEILLSANGGITAMCSVSPGIVNQIMKMDKQSR